MAYYIKVTKTVAESLGYADIRNKTADGNYLLWQADLTKVEGGSLTERISNVGGVKLSPSEAKAETDGIENPASVYTPALFGGEVEQLNEGNNE